MLSDWKAPIEKSQSKLAELQKALDMTSKEQEAARLEEESAQPGFWDNQEAAQALLQKLTGLKASISTYQSLVSQQEDLQTLWELANEEQDEDLEPEIEQARDRKSVV